MALFVIIIIMVIVAPVLSKKCNAPYSQPGFKIHGHVLKTISSSTIMQCEQKCASEQNCQSVNFYQAEKKCELNAANHISSPASLFPSQDCQYVDFQQRQPSKCSRKLCSEPLACVPEGAKGYQCKPCQGKILEISNNDSYQEIVALPAGSLCFTGLIDLRAE